MNTFDAILRAYLAQEPDSEVVFSDYLEEHGLPRLSTVHGSSGKLRHIIEHFLTEREIMLLACDFAEHAVNNLDQKLKAPRNAISLVRDWVNGKRKKAKIATRVENGAFSILGSTLPESRTRSAIVNLLNEVPFTVMMAAQESDEDELAWQVEHSIFVIDQKLQSNG